MCAKAARAGRIASLHPAGTRRGGFNAGNLLGAVDRARKVEDRIVEAGGAVVRVGELRGGGSEEPTPPGDGRLGKEFYDTNPDFGAALADQLFDASMCGVKVRVFDSTCAKRRRRRAFLSRALSRRCETERRARARALLSHRSSAATRSRARSRPRSARSPARPAGSARRACSSRPRRRSRPRRGPLRASRSPRSRRSSRRLRPSGAGCCAH